MKPRITFQGKMDEFEIWFKAMLNTYGKDALINAEIFTSKKIELNEETKAILEKAREKIPTEEDFVKHLVEDI